LPRKVSLCDEAFRKNIILFLNGNPAAIGDSIFKRRIPAWIRDRSRSQSHSILKRCSLFHCPSRHTCIQRMVFQCIFALRGGQPHQKKMKGHPGSVCLISCGPVPSRYAEAWRWICPIFVCVWHA